MAEAIDFTARKV